MRRKHCFWKTPIFKILIYFSKCCQFYEGEHCDIGSVHVCDFVQDEFVFGVIGSILLLNSTIYFVWEVCNTSQFLFDYNAYEILNTGNLCLYAIDQLIDIQPLSKYKIDGILLVQLKHFILTPVDE